MTVRMPDLILMCAKLHHMNVSHFYKVLESNQALIMSINTSTSHHYVLPYPSLLQHGIWYPDYHNVLPIRVKNKAQKLGIEAFYTPDNLVVLLYIVVHIHYSNLRVISTVLFKLKFTSNKLTTSGGDASRQCLTLFSSRKVRP